MTSLFQRRVRAAVYTGFRDRAESPTSSQLAAHFGVQQVDILGAFSALAGEHCLVLDKDSEVWMAHPFSAIDTDHVVRIGERKWFANCAWDALAILAVLGDGTFETRCAASGAALRFAARAGTIEGDGVVHFLVPVREFWNDIGHT